ncbi:hypothetical protein GQ42DRAFT_158209 [Ramicandelaber brevisporus]|nr:hypothetical protein GQ42DRAFT_158209 [Ramicandelaber brevisporus]
MRTTLVRRLTQQLPSRTRQFHSQRIVLAQSGSGSGLFDRLFGKNKQEPQQQPQQQADQQATPSSLGIELDSNESARLAAIEAEALKMLERNNRTSGPSKTTSVDFGERPALDRESVYHALGAALSDIAAIHSEAIKAASSAEAAEAAAEATTTDSNIDTSIESTELPEWTKIPLVSAQVKFEIGRRCMDAMQREIPNAVLTNAVTAGDFATYFVELGMPSKQKYPVAAYFESVKDKLPKNMKFEPYNLATRDAHVEH